ncbi:hypothetical protein [Gluconacetobacter sacchari]|uniref:hypothetical protein n=1 Tax=Gluconacetobacter sacchari TaxID=92759 RepID=UPI001FE52674|nr:hypothetical protein [Gluconacetobacter sacchari]
MSPPCSPADRPACSSRIVRPMLRNPAVYDMMLPAGSRTGHARRDGRCARDAVR